MLVCTVWYTAVCSSAVFVVFRMNSGPCLMHKKIRWLYAFLSAETPLQQVFRRFGGLKGSCRYA